MPRRSRTTPPLLFPDTEVPRYSSEGGAPPPYHSHSNTPSPMGTPPLPSLRNWPEDSSSRLPGITTRSSRHRNAESSASSSSSRPAQLPQQPYAYQPQVQSSYHIHQSYIPPQPHNVPQAPRSLARPPTNDTSFRPEPFSPSASPSIDYLRSVHATIRLPPVHTGYTQPATQVQQHYPPGTENVSASAPVSRPQTRRDGPSATPRRRSNQ